MLKPGPLATALEKDRDRYNARFALARRRNRSLDPDDFARILIETVDPLVRAAAKEAPDCAEAVAEALYDLSLDLLVKDCLGPKPRFPAVAEVWRELLPLTPELLAQDPRRLVAALSNAAYNIEAERSGGNVALWLKIMTRAAPLCRGLEAYLQVGQVAAWRAGLAHFRESALEVWQSLPEDLAYAGLGLNDSKDRPGLEELKEKLADPWYSPHDNSGRKRKMKIVARIGDFQGFGGLFSSPPDVTAADGVIYVFDREYCWSLHADCFGSVLRRFGSDLPENAGGDQGAFKLDSKGRVENDGAANTFPELKNAAAFASNQHTLAVTLPRSHRVWLVASVAQG